MRILATGLSGVGQPPHFQESQKVDRPKTSAVTTVILSSRRSSAVPPERLEVPPNMSDNPLPLPEWSKMNTIRNRLDRMHSPSAMTLAMAAQCTGSAGRSLDHRSVLEREVTGGHLTRVVREQLGLFLAAPGELGVRAAGVEPAARGRVDRARHVALQDDPLLGSRDIRVRDRHR